MVEHPHVNQCKGFFQPAGDRFIRMAGFSNAAGVVMKQQRGRGITCQCLLHHDPWMNRSTIDGAVKQLGDIDDPMAVVELC